MSFEFVVKLPIPAEIKKQFPMSEKLAAHLKQNGQFQGE